MRFTGFTPTVALPDIVLLNEASISMLEAQGKLYQALLAVQNCSESYQDGLQDCLAKIAKADDALMVANRALAELRDP